VYQKTKHTQSECLSSSTKRELRCHRRRSAAFAAISLFLLPLHLFSPCKLLLPASNKFQPRVPQFQPIRRSQRCSRAPAFYYIFELNFVIRLFILSHLSSRFSNKGPPRKLLFLFTLYLMGNYANYNAKMGKFAQRALWILGIYNRANKFNFHHQKRKASHNFWLFWWAVTFLYNFSSTLSLWVDDNG